MLVEGRTQRAVARELDHVDFFTRPSAEVGTLSGFAETALDRINEIRRHAGLY